MAKKAEPNRPKAGITQSPFYKKFGYDIIIVLFSIILYSNAVLNDYNMDDELVTNNHKLTSKGISAIPEIFTSPYYSDDSGYAYEYRPVVLVSYAIEHSMFGDNPITSHLLNILFYAVCCLVLFHLLQRMFKGYSPVLSFVVTLLFIAHPAHTEVVCSAKNRDEILGLLFSLLAMHMVFSFAESTSIWKLLGAVALFSLALMCKITFLVFATITPLAIILFSEIDFKYVIAVAASFLLPLHFLLDIGSPFDKILLEIGFVLATGVLFVLLRPLNLKGIFSAGKLPDEHFASVHLFSGFKDFSLNILPAFSSFLVFPFFLTSIVSIVFVWALVTNNTLVEYATTGILLLLAVWQQNRAAVFARAFLYLNLTAAVLYIFVSGGAIAGPYQDYVAGLAFIVLFYEFFFGLPNLRILTAGCILSLVGMLIFAYSGNDYLNFIMVFAFFLALKAPKSKAGMLVIGLGAIAAAITTVSLLYTLIVNPKDWHYFFPHIFAALFAVTLLYNSLAKYVLFSTLVFLAFLVSPLSPAFTNLKPMPVKSNMVAIAKKVDVKLYAAKTDRPLAFLENPVDYKSSLSVRLGTSLTILFHYVYKVIVPYPMAFYYGYSFIKPQSIMNTVPVLSLVIHFVLLLLAILLGRRHKIISFSIWLYLLSIVIYSNFFYPIPGLLAERFLLVPSLGWCILLTFLLFQLFKATDIKKVSLAQLPSTVKYTFGLLLLFYSTITFSRNFDWKDHITLMRKDVEYVQTSAQAHNLLALNIMKYSMTLGKPDVQKALWGEAIIHFKKSLEIYPSTFNVAYDLGRVYSMLYETDSCLRYFSMADTIDPQNDFPPLKMNLGMIYQQKEQYDSALSYFLQYNRLVPTDINGYDKLGYIYYLMGRKDLTLAISKQAVVNLPSEYRSYYNMARSYVELNQIDSAIYYLKIAQQINPADQSLAQSIQALSARK
jgi:tetratricopeptide (TPR) repeat protein